MATPSLVQFSKVWIRPQLSGGEIAALERKGLVERRSPKSALLRLTAKGEIVKFSQSYRKNAEK